MRVLPEKNYSKMMRQVVEPYLKEREQTLWLWPGKERMLHCMGYRADHAQGVVVLCHGYTETAEKYKENIYYFLREGYHVYMPEHCGHGFSYRLSMDLSLVYIDRFERYVEDFLFAVRSVREHHPDMPLYLYGHSMGGGIAACAAARGPALFDKIVLSSPMIRPKAACVPWRLARLLAAAGCAKGRAGAYMPGQKPYSGAEQFEKSSSTSRVRFDYYQAKRAVEPRYHLNAGSYGWLHEADRMNRYLMHRGWKEIKAPVRIFQAERDHLVSKKEQRRFAEKLARRKGMDVKLICVPGTKHEIFNSSGRLLWSYWKQVFSFFQ